MTRITIKQKVLALAAELGAEVVYGQTKIFEITADAPDGHHWKCDELHQLVSSRWDNESIARLWQDMFERMSEGIEPCDYKDENCQNARETIAIITDLIRTTPAETIN